MNRDTPLAVTIADSLVTLDLSDRRCYQAVLELTAGMGYMTSWENHPGGEHPVAKQLRDVLAKHRYFLLIIAFDGHDVSVLHSEGGGEHQYIQENMSVEDLLEHEIEKPATPGFWKLNGQLDIHSWRSFEGDYEEDIHVIGDWVQITSQDEVEKLAPDWWARQDEDGLDTNLLLTTVK